jgi:hypothetical protein
MWYICKSTLSKAPVTLILETFHLSLWVNTQVNTSVLLSVINIQLFRYVFNYTCHELKHKK